MCPDTARSNNRSQAACHPPLAVWLSKPPAKGAHIGSALQHGASLARRAGTAPYGCGRGGGGCCTSHEVKRFVGHDQGVARLQVAEGNVEGRAVRPLQSRGCQPLGAACTGTEVCVRGAAGGASRTFSSATCREAAGRRRRWREARGGRDDERTAVLFIAVSGWVGSYGTAPKSRSRS